MDNFQGYRCVSNMSLFYMEFLNKFCLRLFKLELHVDQYNYSFLYLQLHNSNK